MNLQSFSNMSFRFMRVIVMFDLPVTTSTNRRDYRLFRKHLIETGFIMMQESIYCKLVQNPVAADVITQNIRKSKPSEGLVQVLKITERQFSKIEYILGEKNREVIDSFERIVIL